MTGSEAGSDVPPSGSLVDAILGRGPERVRSLGEYSSATYPTDLAELLRRRERVTEDVLRIDITDPAARAEAVPHLRSLLRVYPHPLVYELLIHAYVDTGRFDEARGVAFAAQARRQECARSDYPEIRAEIDHLKEWTVAEVEQMQAERERRGTAPE